MHVVHQADLEGGAGGCREWEGGRGNWGSLWAPLAPVGLAVPLGLTQPWHHFLTGKLGVRVPRSGKVQSLNRLIHQSPSNPG